MNPTTLNKSLQLKKLDIRDSFWTSYIRLVRDVVVPYQWEALNDRVEGAAPSYAIRNMKIAAGLEQGSFNGMVFQDSDIAKWLEAVSYLLESEANPELERIADELIDVIAQAQQKDGYLNTYFTIKEPDGRWTNLAECHELYCAGHLIEAGVAYYQATGKRKLLDVCCRMADYIDSVFGPKPGQIQGYDGHQEVELALVKLYRVVKNEKYLSLSKFFIDERGKEPSFYEQELKQREGKVHFPFLDMAQDLSYSQAHLPVRLQTSAEGHAVRAVYMYSGMADIVAETGDQQLLEACQRLWSSIVEKRMYITGAIGSMSHGESFSLDYDLPNDSAYAETCASIGLIMFAQRMLLLEPRSEYADVLEKALYNTVISGMSRDGKRFFYVNPLEVWPDACDKNHTFSHVKPVRQEWFGCACCPPNIARLLASLNRYIVSVQDRTIYTHLYIGGELECELDGQPIHFTQQSNFPWDGDVLFKYEGEQIAHFTMALRIPNWCPGASVLINGHSISLEPTIVNGYAHIARTWQPGDVIELSLPMPVTRMRAHPSVRETVGKIALQRGPIVYCVEEADNGANLHHITLDGGCEFSVEFEPELLGGLQTITAKGVKIPSTDWGNQLYKSEKRGQSLPTTVKFIPYFAWANRGRGEMAVWVRE
ncbi:glycoside hydrolase family 127 protein [Cohnella sp. WQ 127256]|uniref:glycoside hydrolase family 127 protein n=1 Tax=Cohnella sp. WQ 127256 TaxID=2938790 RepID=UPI0021178B71|nr:beta-L-arabinofuranosidase domain-containing protein [Cohnella sp. WQ 127256]